MNTDKILAEAIAKEYAPKESSKLVALKKLDTKAKLPANIFAYTFGIATTLLAGLGMSLAMRVIGGTTAFMILGIILGIIGFAGCAITYPVYKKILEKSKSKYAFEIVELAREISES
ncbi:MAG: dihydropteridine reductase [Acutalibacteraceae bacterium]|nr:dihydropteridine reductase [Acutalibacteraceae bacterium]